MTAAELRERIMAALRARASDASVRVLPEQRDSIGVDAPCGYATWGEVEVIATGDTELDALAALAVAVGLDADGADPRAEVERLRAALAMTQREREETEDASELDHLDALLSRQHAILTGVANALRGDPGPLASHSHHDLAERAAAVVAERDAAVADAARARAAYATDLDGLRAEVRRADDERDVRRAEAARLTAKRDAAHAVVAGLREEISDAADTLHRLSLAQQRLASAGDRGAWATSGAYARAAQIVATVGDAAAVRMEPMTASALDAACAAEDRACVDEPLLDGTDGAHPAWWRGHDRAAEVLTAQRDAALAACGEQSAEDGATIQRFGAALNAETARAETAERERDAALADAAQLRAAAREMLAALEAPAPVWDADEAEHDEHAARLTAALDASRALLAGGAS